jgi:multidrug efflux pump subunit AcrA (membrane-fusion protein)
MKKITVFMFIVPVIATAMLLVSCKRGDEVGVEDYVPVTTLAVDEGSIVNRIDVYGKLFPKQEVNVFPKLDGDIIELYVREGDTVKKGQNLAKIKQNIPGADFAPGMVNSPIAGVVLRSNFDIGSAVTRQTQVFQIGDLTCLYFRGQVFGEDIARIESGQVLYVDDGVSDKGLGLQVTRISPRRDEITGGVTIEAQICFVGKRTLMPGQSVDGYIETGEIRGISVPRNALVKNGGDKRGVYIIKEERARFVPVSTTASDENGFLVEGIVAGTEVIIDGAQIVKEGDLVKIVDLAAAE